MNHEEFIIFLNKIKWQIYKNKMFNAMKALFLSFKIVKIKIILS